MCTTYTILQKMKRNKINEEKMKKRMNQNIIRQTSTQCSKEKKKKEKTANV